MWSLLGAASSQSRHSWGQQSSQEQWQWALLKWTPSPRWTRTWQSIWSHSIPWSWYPESQMQGIYRQQEEGPYRRTSQGAGQRCWKMSTQQSPLGVQDPVIIFISTLFFSTPEELLHTACSSVQLITCRESGLHWKLIPCSPVQVLYWVWMLRWSEI